MSSEYRLVVRTQNGTRIVIEKRFSPAILEKKCHGEWHEICVMTDGGVQEMERIVRLLNEQ